MRQGPIVQQTSLSRPGFRRQLVTAGVIVGSIAIILLVSYFLFLPKKQRFVLESYTWSEVKRRDIRETLQVSGTIDLATTGVIVSPEQGYVEQVFHESGDMVERGELLVKIVPQDLEDTLADLQGSLGRLTRSLEELRLLRSVETDGEQKRLATLQKEATDSAKALDGLQKMKSSGYVSALQIADAQKALEKTQAAVDEMQSSMKSSAIRYQYGVQDAQADIDQVKAKIAKLQARIDACAVTSPVTGKVMKVDIARGALVPQFASLATVGNFRTPVLNLSVPAEIQNRVSVGQEAVITLTNKQYRAKVDWKGLLAEQSAGTSQSLVGAKLSFEELPADFVPGSAASAEILLGIRSNVLSLPRGQYLTTGGGLVLYRIEGAKAYKTEVRLGVTTSSAVEIVNGVEEGERIITSSYQDFMSFDEIVLASGGGISGDTTPGSE